MSLVVDSFLSSSWFHDLFLYLKLLHVSSQSRWEESLFCFGILMTQASQFLSFVAQTSDINTQFLLIYSKLSIGYLL